MKKLHLILAFLLLATPCYSQTNLQKLQIIDFSKGMNSYDNPDVLQDGVGASMVNVVLSQSGKLTKRKGQAMFNADEGNTGFTGIGRFDPDKTTSYMVVSDGVAVKDSLSNSTSWETFNPASALTSGKDTEFIQANNFLFVLNGFDAPIWWDGNNLFKSFGYELASPPTTSTGVWTQNYLFLTGNPVNQDWIYVSNNLNPQKFTSGDILRVNTGDGQAIQKLQAFRINEIVVYKERSIYLLDISGATPITDWTIQPISTVTGTVAPRSVVSLGNDQWFLSSEPVAIRSLARTQYDKILLNYISRPLQDIFEASGNFPLNKVHMSKACAILYDNKYLLAIPTGTSTVNNTVLVYDFVTEAWYLIKGWYPAEWEVFDNRLFYIDANDGRVLECFTGTTGDFAVGPMVTGFGSDPQQGIEWVYQTASIDFDLPENYKQIDSIEAEFDPTGNFYANIWINLDNTGWSSVGSVNLAGQTLTLPMSLPTKLNNSGVAKRIIDLDNYGEFRKMQVMTENKASMQTVTLQRITIFSTPKPWRRSE
jgi:hypothetical protein